MTDEPVNIAIPVLASLDLEESAAFYEKIGFRIGARFDEYLIVHRNSIEIHFWKCDERHIAENTSCYLRVTDVADWYIAVSAHDLSPGRMSDLEDRVYGMREFYVWDPHGNLIKFGEIIDG
jgi:hypothetical protein